MTAATMCHVTLRVTIFLAFALSIAQAVPSLVRRDGGDDSAGLQAKGDAKIEPTGFITMSLTRVESPSSSPTLPAILAATEAEKDTSVDLRNADNTQYIGTISVGTPPVEFRAILDSGSANTWFYSSACADFASNPQCSTAACNNHRRHSRSASSSFAQIQGQDDDTTYTIKYGSGEVTGRLISETVHIGGQPVAGFKSLEATCVKSYEAAVFDDSDFDAVVGLGFAELGIDGTKPLVRSLVEQRIISKEQFWFKITSHNQAGSMLGVGEVDPNLFSGSIKWHNVIGGAKHWALKLCDIKVAGKSIDMTDRKSVV